MFKGSMVALVTPMQADGSIDKKSFADLIEWHIASKTNAIIVSGTTGEGSTLTNEERNELIKLAVTQAKKRIPIIAGTGTNSTQATIQRTLEAQNAGVDACLLVTPYYNKPTQAGLYEHFKTVAENTAVPLILYNVPSRTACDMLPETVQRLSTVERIIGIKEATGKLERAEEIAKLCGKDFLLFSGDDATGMNFMLKGGHGVISVTTNVAPEQMSAMCNAALSGNKTLAEKINAELMSLHQKLFLEANPIPTKWVLNEMGKIPAGIRLPLTPLSAKYHSELRQAMQEARLQQTAKV
jgi:4-hydroxy-tetrahydrodipicolinate synthase